jgi:hypothetical protein
LYYRAAEAWNRMARDYNELDLRNGPAYENSAGDLNYIERLLLAAGRRMAKLSGGGSFKETTP